MGTAKRGRTARKELTHLPSHTGRITRGQHSTSPMSNLAKEAETAAWAGYVAEEEEYRNLLARKGEK